MIAEATKTLFSCPWRRDASGYRILRSMADLTAVKREAEQLARSERQPDGIMRAAPDWPDHWPDIRAWIDRALETPRIVMVKAPGDSALRAWDRAPLATGSSRAERVIEGGGVLFPESSKGEFVDVLHGLPGSHDVLTEFLNCGIKTNDESSAILEFTNRCGLLWSDSPVTLENFRYCRDELRRIASVNKDKVSSEDLAKLDKWSPTAAMKWKKGESRKGKHAASGIRFELRDLFGATVYQLGQTFTAEQPEWRKCRECPTLFTAGPGGTHSAKALACSDKCARRYQNRIGNQRRDEKRRLKREKARAASA